LPKSQCDLKTASAFSSGRARTGHALITRFIADHQVASTALMVLGWGGRVDLHTAAELGVPIAPSTYYDQVNREPSRRESVTRTSSPDARFPRRKLRGLRTRKVWLALNREGIAVARCTVERLMAELGLAGPPEASPDAPRLRIRGSASSRFGPTPVRPTCTNRLWVADLTYVSTWSGLPTWHSVVDAYARRILGWRGGMTDGDPMVLDAIEQSIGRVSRKV